MKTDTDRSKEHWLEGLDDYIEVLEDAEGKQKPKTDYRKLIQQKAEWKLREKQEKPKGQSKPKPTTTPKTTAPTEPKPKTHGDPPRAPQGQEYYWYDYTPKGKGA